MRDRITTSVYCQLLVFFLQPRECVRRSLMPTLRTIPDANIADLLRRGRQQRPVAAIHNFATARCHGDTHGRRRR
jgi:hypothetical protein